VLAPVAALVLPVVRGGMDHAQVGRGGVVEQLGYLREREGVRVLAPGRVAVSAFDLEPREAVSGLVGERVGALGGDPFVAAAVTAAEAHPPVVRARLVGAVASEQDHVDDRVERGVEEHVEGALGVVLELGRHLVHGYGGRGSRH
jgi:hypothetical protein